MCTLYYYASFIRFYLFIVIKTYCTSLMALLNANDIIDIAESALVAAAVAEILRAYIHTAALDRHVFVPRISEVCDIIEIVYKWF